MALEKSLKCGFWSILLGCCLLAGNMPASAEEDEAVSAEHRQAVQAGVELEQSRRWLDAIEHYEQALEKWPDNKRLQYGLRRSKIHFGIERRYSDGSFENRLLSWTRAEALELFEDVWGKVHSHYAEPISATSFVAHGTESLYLALANDKFSAQHLWNVDRGRVGKMRAILRRRYWNRPVADRDEARQVIGQVCDLAKKHLGLKPTTVVMEYIFGGCNALDDYSNCLTPNRLADLRDSIDGEFVGLGIEMKAEAGQGMLLVNVLPGSPAAEGGMVPGDHIVAIEGTDCREMTTDEAARLLRGPKGSTVRLKIESNQGGEVWTGRFNRRPVEVQSIAVARIIDEKRGIGYIQMTGFQKTTASELDSALKSLHEDGMRALIWDLRGNPGGLLTAAVEVLDRFIAEGTLVSTRGRTSDQNWKYSAHRLGTWNLPLVLLVNGESASASEIVAGAIRDQGRGTIVGRTTYGKWSVQSIFPVDGSAGLRLTTAKFYSPNGDTLGHVGVQPDVVVETKQEYTTLYRGASNVELADDADLSKGLEILRNQVPQP